MTAKTSKFKSIGKKMAVVLLPFLATTPLTLLLSSSPSQAQQVGCNRLVFPDASFRSHATYPGDPNLYSWNFNITNVSGSTWSGVYESGERVHGTMSGDRFTLRRPEGQTWTGVCTVDGISGNFRKDGLSAVGSFVLNPQ